MDPDPSTKGRPRAIAYVWIGAAVVAIAAVALMRRPRTAAIRRPNVLVTRPNTGPGNAARPDASQPSPDAGRSDAQPRTNPNPPPRYREHMGELFASERAVVAPLAIGAALGPTQVFEIAHHADARIMVGVRAGTREGWLRINASQGASASQGTIEGPFVITAEDGSLAPTERDAAVTALAAVLHRNVAVPVPREMQPLGGPPRADAGRDAT